jgi:hypothetical protein
MSGEPPEWMLWVPVGGTAFMLFLSASPVHGRDRLMKRLLY